MSAERRQLDAAPNIEVVRETAVAVGNAGPTLVRAEREGTGYVRAWSSRRRVNWLMMLFQLPWVAVAAKDVFLLITHPGRVVWWLVPGTMVFASEFFLEVVSILKPTSITMDENGMVVQIGFRRVEFIWGEIREVEELTRRRMWPLLRCQSIRVHGSRPVTFSVEGLPREDLNEILDAVSERAQLTARDSSSYTLPRFLPQGGPSKGERQRR